MAALALAAAGAAIGSIWGSAAIGWAVGSALGSFLFAPKITQEGPRLGDLKVQTSTYGTSIPICSGSIRVAGNVIWSTDIIETRTESEEGGKGGGGGGVTVVNYSYSQSFAVAVCEGQIAGIRKIWANGKLIYNLSDTASIETIAASNRAAAGIQIYTGSETQTPNSLIQAHVGAANTPAYRGTAYIVFNRLQLAAYGNRMPNLEFEIIKVGSPYSTVAILNTAAPFRSLSIMNGIIYTETNAYGGSSEPTCYTVDGASGWIGDETYELIGAANGLLVGRSNIFASPIHISRDGGASWIEKTVFPGTLSWGWPISAVYGNGIWVAIVFASSDANGEAFYSEDNGETWLQTRIPGIGQNLYEKINFAGDRFVASPRNGGGTAYSYNGRDWYLYAVGLPAGSYVRSTSYDNSTDKLYAFNSLYSAFAGRVSSDKGATWANFSGPGIAGLAATAAAVGGGWIFISTYGVAGREMFVSDNDGATWITLDSPSDYANAVAWSSGAFYIAGTAGLYAYSPHVITGTAADLSSIVSDICLRAGLTAGQIDVTALTDEVHGYVVQRSSARAQIEQLMQAYHFDAVESSGKIKFVKRGMASLLTIAEDDLAAHEYGSEVQDTVTIDRMQEMELPVEVDIQYLSVNSAYQVSAQSSRRLTTESENKVSINLAIAMTGAKAKEIADVLMYDAWTGRTRFGFQTGWKYCYLEPTDVIRIVKGGRVYTVRITDEDYGMVSDWRAVLEDSSVYSQSGAAYEGLPPDENISLAPTTKLMLMDIPLLRDQDDGVGFYAAACGYSDGWSGAQVFKSSDGEATWNSFGNGIINPAAIGSATTVLASFTQNVFDEKNSVTVTLISGELSSDTELNVLNGSNVALLGDEIIQFKTATLVSGKTYTLSGLLRGRRGTEWATHAVGERFVLLTPASTYILIGQIAEYDLQRHYRGVTLGGFLDDAETIAFTNTAVAQIPLSPVQLGGGRNAAGDITLKWTRRTRIGGGWNSFSDVPLGESSELYVVEIYSNSGYGTVKRTITGLTTPTASYTAAQQTTDFGSAQATVYWKVYQVSSTVGNGYEARGVT